MANRKKKPNRPSVHLAGLTRTQLLEMLRRAGSWRGVMGEIGCNWHKLRDIRERLDCLDIKNSGRDWSWLTRERLQDIYVQSDCNWSAAGRKIGMSPVQMYNYRRRLGLIPGKEGVNDGADTSRNRGSQGEREETSKGSVRCGPDKQLLETTRQGEGRRLPRGTEASEEGSRVEVSLPRDWIPILTESISGEKGWLDLFYPAQKGFTVDPRQTVLFIGGNGTGKTLVGSVNTVQHLLGVHPRQMASPPLNARVVASSFEDGVKKVLLEKLLFPSRLRGGTEMGPIIPESEVKQRFDDRRRTIIFKNGSKLEFMTHDQSPLQHAGSERDMVWFDEEPPVKHFGENKARLRSAKGGGKVFFTMTPPFEPGAEPSWTKETFIDRKPRNTGIYYAAMADNPNNTREFIDAFCVGLTEEEIAVRVFGKYPEWGRLVYPVFKDRYSDDEVDPGHLVRYFDIPANWPRLMSIDYHPAKPCAALWIAVDPKNNIYFYDEMGGKAVEGRPIRDLAGVIKQKEGALPADQRYFDPSGHQRQQGQQSDWTPIQEFGRYGIYGANADREWQTGWSKFNQYLLATLHGDRIPVRDPETGKRVKHPKCFIFDTLTELRWSLLNHVWVRRGEKTEPSQKGKDQCDNARYLCQSNPAYYSRHDSEYADEWTPDRNLRIYG